MLPRDSASRVIIGIIRAIRVNRITVGVMMVTKVVTGVISKP